MIPLVGQRAPVTVVRWNINVVVRCPCAGQEILLLQDAPVVCPTCGVTHQFAALDINGEAIAPAQVGFRLASFVPRLQPAD